MKLFPEEQTYYNLAKKSVKGKVDVLLYFQRAIRIASYRGESTDRFKQMIAIINKI